MESGTSVKVAVRIRPLSSEESNSDGTLCINTVPGMPQILAGTDAFFTFDNVYGVDSSQAEIYDDCVVNLVNAAFEGFNATILAYGQTGSGKTWTMGSASSSDARLGSENVGIIPRVITNIFEIMEQKEQDDPNSTYKVQVQFLEIYGENIRDLLDHTRTSKVAIRETATGEVFVSGAREEFVSCASQMMKALEDGTKHRTTASTLMNSSSSRSHAIFTVFLEHTIHTSAPQPAVEQEEEPAEQSDKFKIDEEIDAAQERGDQKITHSKEVRRCKFHFVDLAGSERAKRTGAQGQQLKEGIDINKGLLALGNVISALGDESRKGKIHVPYRVSKLTRMLQDSLGGNSKTLMICCVSPSGINFYESLNALRYANRARNIQNKPVVNRDPTLVMIDDLKKIVQTLASELIDVRKRSLTPSPEGTLSISELEVLLANGNIVSKKPLTIEGGDSSPKFKVGRRNTAFDLVSAQSIMQATRNYSVPSGGTANSSPQNMSPTMNHHSHHSNNATPRRKESNAHSSEIVMLKSRASEADFELKRVTEQLKRAKVEASEMSERVVLIQSERDFYHIKYSDLKPEDSMSFYKDPTAPSKGGEAVEKGKVTSMIAGYLRQIEELKKGIAEKLGHTKSFSSSVSHVFDASSAELESELTSNVARVIAQTEKHLLQEAKRLKKIGQSAAKPPDGSHFKVIAALDDGNDTDDDPSLASGDTSPMLGDRKNSFSESQLEEDDIAYQRRQKMISAEVVELGESIELKQQLLGQLMNSQHQYGVMKTFYEQKLTALNLEMSEKQNERDRLLTELQHLEDSTNKNEVEAVKIQAEQEKKLRIQLKKKDDELRQMTKRQEELTNLSRVQSRYTAQVSRLESDIEGMRKQKVDLSKSLQVEKKRHYNLLNEKAKEIDKLKRDLLASAGEAKRLGKDKLKAEERTREALKDSTAMRKKVHEAQRYGTTSENATAKARLARRAMGGVGKSAAPRILSEDELRIKKWLDRKIADINLREEAADTLRKQCEQQLALVNKKEALELERSSMEKSFREVVTGSHGTAKILSKEEKEALKEIEDRLESVDSQLKLRDRNISEIESKLASGDIASAQESAIEALKKNSAVSLPASHELIRLLFDMLVATKSSSQQRKTSLFRSEAREKQLKHDLDDAARHMNALRRTHDMELTRAANEYEEKLAGLFNHSTIGKQMIAESTGEAPEAPPADSVTATGRHRSSAEASYRMLLSVASEQSNLLKSRLERESSRTNDLQSRISEVDHTCSTLQKDIEEKDVHIKFLEDERALFRDLADSLRAGISTLGGETGHTILKQINDRVGGGVASDESDDETESMLGEYSNLGDIITRTGNVTEKKRSNSSDKNLCSLASSAPSSVVYDRLTNPSNFTGSMKNAFGEDLEEKRQKVKLIKSGNGPTKGHASTGHRANHNKDHIAAYLEGTSNASGNGVHPPADYPPEMSGLPPMSSRGYSQAAVKDSTPLRLKIGGSGTSSSSSGARALTPPKPQSAQPSPGTRVKCLASVKAGLASISMQLAEGEEPKGRSHSDSITESQKSIPVRTNHIALELTDLDVEASSTVPDTDVETSPIQLNGGGGTQKLWQRVEVLDEPSLRSRRNSLDSVYSSVIDEFKGNPEEEDKLVITIPSRSGSGGSAGPDTIEVRHAKPAKESFPAAAEDDGRYEEEDDYYNVLSPSGNSVAVAVKSREEIHSTKIKNRLQSATAPVILMTPRSPLPKPLNVILKR